MKILYMNGPVHDNMSCVLMEGFSSLAKINLAQFRYLNQCKDSEASIDKNYCVGESAALLSVDWADLIIFDNASNPNWMSDEVKKVFLDKKLRISKSVFVDGSDDPLYTQDVDSFVVYFKKEVRHPCWNFRSSPFVRSISLGILENWRVDSVDDSDILKSYLKEYKDRSIDISFISPISSSLHYQFATFMKSMASGASNLNVFIAVGDSHKKVDRKTYFDILRKSKISVSCPGVGWDNLSTWEIMSSGAVLASYDVSYRLFMRSAPELSRHCVYFESYQQAFSEIMNILMNPSLWCMVRHAADNLCNSHMSISRASQVIQIFSECAPFSKTLNR